MRASIERRFKKKKRRSEHADYVGLLAHGADAWETLKESKPSIPSTLWHVSTTKFRTFSTDHGAQKVLWFGRDKAKLLKGMDGLGAQLRPGEPVWLYKVHTTADNPATSAQYHRLDLHTIKHMGHDSIDLGEVIVVFDPKDVRIVSTEKVRK